MLLVFAVAMLTYTKLQRVSPRPLSRSQVLENGVIHYLSESQKHTLLQRSLFDILCDIWFIGTISFYARKLVEPMIYHMSPEDARQMVNNLPHQRVRKAVLTKVRYLRFMGC